MLNTVRGKEEEGNGVHYVGRAARAELLSLGPTVVSIIFATATTSRISLKQLFSGCSFRFYFSLQNPSDEALR